MTEAEIKKDLLFVAHYCHDEYNEIRVDVLLLNALDLINRQQAEIERLESKVEELSEVLSNSIRIRYSEAKSEAIEEFWSRLQGIAYRSEVEWSHGEHPMLIELDDAEEIYEEMVGDAE